MFASVCLLALRFFVCLCVFDLIGCVCLDELFFVCAGCYCLLPVFECFCAFVCACLFVLVCLCLFDL